jgi:ATP-dependent Clp protease ATP-binding subunit ClpC
MMIGEAMNDSCSEQVRAVLQLAEEEARSFRHEYIGTEHLLLGLIAEGSGTAATVLRARGLGYVRLYQEIEQLVQQGPVPVTAQELPLTPRARQAIQFAGEDARMVGQAAIDTEHLLIGLLREPDGVAGMILRKCGLNIEETSAEVFKIRLLQMKVVERAIRPVQANMARKRRMRDEMLAHLSAIFDEELARSGDSAVAVGAAAKRFGDPAELAAELQVTVPRLEQWEARLEPIFGWRAPETVVRWMMRVALQMGLVMMMTCALAAVLALNEFGWNFSVWLTVRPIAAAAIVLPISVATTGICYYKVRDHIFGVFGSRKSWKQAIVWASVIAGTTVGCGFVFIAVAYGSLATALSLVYPFLAAGILWALSTLFAVKAFGPQEIRDTTWALLDLE